MESMREELGSLREGISKIATLEQGMAKTLNKLNVISPNQGGSVQMMTKGIGRQKLIVIGSTLGQSNQEKNKGEDDSSSEFEGGGEARTRKAEIPTFDSSDLDGWMSRVERFLN